MDLLLIHLVALVWLSVAAAWRWTARGADLVLAAAGLAWGNILLTLLILSIFGRANSAGLGFGLSVTLGTAILLLAWRFPSLVELPAAAVTSPRGRLAALLILAILAGASAAAGVAFAPFAPTALDEALPRAFLLLSPNGLLPRDANGIAEGLFNLNRTALHVWVLNYRPGLATLSFVNFVGWALAGVAVYRASTLAGARRNAAWFATLCALAALPVLAQAATLDHHLWAGTALLATACFLLEYMRQARKSSAALAGLFAGLAAGSSAGALVAVSVAGAWATLAPRSRARVPWKYVGLGLVSGLLPLLLNAALALSADFTAFVTALPHALGGTSFINGASFAGGPVAPTELSVGPGVLGIVSLAAALAALRRLREPDSPSAWLALGSLLWLGGAGIATIWRPFDAREWVATILLAGPSVALLADRVPWSRAVAWLGGLVLIGGGLWSAHGYLWGNAWRPLRSWWDHSITLRLPSELALALEFHLAQDTRLRLTPTVSADALAASGPRNTCMVFPLSGSARLRPLAELEAGPSYVLLAFPRKPTAGVEYLGRAHLGIDARDYFGIPDRPNNSAAERNHNLLLIVKRGAATAPLQVDLAGLHPADAAQLEIVAESKTGQRTTLAVLADSGSRSLPLPSDLRRLHFRIQGSNDGVEKGVAILEERSADEFVQPTANDLLRVLGVELVARTSPAPIQVDAHLLAPDGPFPQWNMPLTRAMRAETIRLVIPSQPGLAALRLSFSARLQNRPQGILAVICNGEERRRLSFDEPLTWQQVVVDAPALPGENVIELRDLPLPPSPDWSAYLQRYPDVRIHLELTHQPPFEGARIHYESSGRAEGRTVVLVAPPRPAPDALYYLFRSLRVEGLRP